MGKRTSGIYRDKDAASGQWHIDKWYRGERIRRRGFVSFEEADGWLTKELAERRTLHLHGMRPNRSFDQAAAKHLLESADKDSIDLDVYLLGLVMPYLGHLEIGEIDADAIEQFTSANLRKTIDGDPLKGRGTDGKLSAKTIDLAIGLVSSILQKAANTWKHARKVPWLDRAPKLPRPDLEGNQRPPRPINWIEQAKLFEALPQHLRDMALFCVNTGVRDNVVCNLRWSWEVRIPELGGRSLFVVPKEFVKGKKKKGTILCNSVAQEVVERCRGKHREFVFVYRRERIKNFEDAPLMPYRPVGTMNNTAWQSGRRVAGLDGLHVHDLRHTFATRLREAKVAPQTIRDLLWHGDVCITDHYSLAQMVELAEAIETVAKDSGRWNRSLDMILREQQQAT